MAQPKTPEVKTPTPATLRKYGLSLLGWEMLGAMQNWVCFVCERPPKSGRLCIDHEHVRGWKQMPPDERRKYVRGLLCWTCNHYALARGMTIQRALNVAEYLKRYQARWQDADDKQS